MMILYGIQRKGLLEKGGIKEDGKGNEFKQFHVHKLEQCFKSMSLFIKAYPFIQLTDLTKE